MINKKHNYKNDEDLIFLNKQYSYFQSYVNKDVNMVYHYTSLDTLSKIIENSTLRFSNINYQNDECEFTYFFLLLDEHLQEYESYYDKTFYDYLDKLCSKYCTSPFYYTGPDIQSDGNRQYYISSFSLTDDNLALWTLYTKEKNFIGCNFGIQPNGISIYSVNDLLTKGVVIYNRDEQDRLLKELLFVIFDKYKKNNYSINFLEKIQIFLNKYALFFKHPAFEQEKEYRFVYKPNENFNIQNFENKPYIDLPFNIAIDIKSVKLSPTLRADTYIKELKRLFNKKHLKTKIFTTSMIPFSNKYSISNE